MLREAKGYIFVDPGTITGWSVYSATKRLVACGKIKKAELYEFSRDLRGHVGVVEEPILYQRGKMHKKGPDADILKLGIFAGECRAWLRHLGCVEVDYKFAVAWKGQIPKAMPGETYIIEHRLMRVLSEEERALIYGTKSARAKAVDHNIVDSAYMGAVILGRTSVL